MATLLHFSMPRLFLALSAVLALCSHAPTLNAQSPGRGDRVTVRSGTALRGTPGGDVIGVSSREISGTVEMRQSSFVRVTVQGHVAAADVRLTADRTRGEVLKTGGTTLRREAERSAASVAELRLGTYVFPMRAGTSFPRGRDVVFFEARRSLWVDVSRVTTGAAVAAAAERPAAPTAEKPAANTSRETDSAQPTPTPAPVALPPLAAGPTLETRGPTALRTSPTGELLATVSGGVPITTLAREGGWVRVRLEGWIPDSATEAAGTRSSGMLSAADLRANPEGTRGRLVQWSVETLAFQIADELRRGLEPGEAYLLARGPGDERAVLYLAVPDSLLTQAQALRPLTEITITARVRNGRSLPAGVPILELLDFTRR